MTFSLQTVLCFLALGLTGALGATAQGQDRHDWQSVGQLHTGDKIHLFLKTGRVTGAFQSSTPEQITAGTVTAKKEDVLKIERYSQRRGQRAKSAAVGALIGFGGGFAIGAAAGGCSPGGFGPCFSRGFVGAVVGVVGAVIGAGIGALLPRGSRELIYSAK